MPTVATDALPAPMADLAASRSTRPRSRCPASASTVDLRRTAAAAAPAAARADLRELETLLHGVAVQVDTPYTYERAAVLLERAGEHGPGAVGLRGLAGHPAASWPEYTAAHPGDGKHRARLRVRLKPVPAAAR